MSQAFDHIVRELDNISAEEKQALRQLLDERLTAPQEHPTPGAKLTAFGWAKGRVTIGDDFDAPIEDFKEYIE
jgi:hypothetical protein